MKKIIAFLAVLLLLPFLFATDINCIIENAKENSSRYQGILNSKSLSDRMFNLNSKGHGRGIEVSVSQNQEASDVFKYYPTSSVTVTLPKLIDDLELKLGFAASQKTEEGIPVDGEYLFVPNLSMSKTFDFSDDDLSNSSSLINTIKAETDFEKAVLSFESSVIKDIISIMDARSELDTTEKSYLKAVKAYEDSILLGQIDRDSLQDLAKKMELETAKTRLKSARLSVKSLEEAFEHNYGFKFEAVDEVAEYDLTFNSSESGNSDVYLKKLALLSATYDYNKAVGANPSLKLNSTLSPAAYNAGLTFESGNLAIKASATAVQGENGKFTTPKLTIAGTWGKSESLDVNKDNFELKILDAQNNYDNALFSYRTSAAALEAKIRNFKDSLSVFEIQKDYHNRVLEAQTTLFNEGYISNEAYQEAKDAVLADFVKDVTNSLQGLLIEIEIKTMEL